MRRAFSELIPNPDGPEWNHPNFFNLDVLAVLELAFIANSSPKDTHIKDTASKIWSRPLISPSKDSAHGCHPFILEQLITRNENVSIQHQQTADSSKASKVTGE